jgi:two-component system response regulator FixJ
LPLAFRKRLVGNNWTGTTPGDFTINEESKKGILVLIEPDGSVRDALTVLLEGENWRVNSLEDCNELNSAIEKTGVVAVISESSLPSCTPQEIFEQCSRRDLPVIFTGHDLPLQGAVDLIRQGAMDFLDKPFPQSRLLDLLDRLFNRQNT